MGKHTKPHGAETISESLIRVGLVPDVLPQDFHGNVTVEVTFNTLILNPEMNLSPHEVESTPQVQLQSTSGTNLYTVVMVDADYAESSPYVHMLVTNVPGKEGDSRKGDVICEYSSPARHQGKGTHRVLIAALEQQGHLTAAGPKHRTGFSLTGFAQSYGLTPVGATYFLLERPEDA